MGPSAKKTITFIIRILDPLLALLLAPAVVVLKAARTIGLHQTPAIKKMLMIIGVLPVRNHYYEPQIDYQSSPIDYGIRRNLPGIQWNTDEQLALLEKFDTQDELAQFASPSPDERRFHIDNDLFGPGDADFWYQYLRHAKPRRIIEIGCGNSTLVALAAIAANRDEDPAYQCSITCIEPYEQPWLEELDIELIRKPVEQVDTSFFACLEAGDVLFIDSSHVIRPAGDVLYEYLSLLPALNTGVVVHVHDIFSPRNYPREWLESEMRLWNEQYLLEAFLSENPNWQIVAALNLLRHEHFEEFSRASHFLEKDTEPKSFYMKKVG